MTSPSRIPSGSNPQPPRWSRPTTPERPDELSVVEAPAPVAVGDKRPPAMAFVAENSPNKLRRLALPAKRWAGAPLSQAPSLQPSTPAPDAPEMGLDWSDPVFNEPLAPSGPHGVQFDLPSVDSLDAFLGDPALCVLTPPPWCLFEDSEAHEVTHEVTCEAAQNAVENTLAPHPPTPAVATEPVSTVVTRRPTKPTFNLVSPEDSRHRDIIAELRTRPQKTIGVSLVLRFLVYLEQIGLHWDTLREDEINLRPLNLENHVNKVIKDKEIANGLRSALNTLFGLRLHGDKLIRPAWKPKRREHLDLIASKTPKNPSPQEKREMANLAGLLGYLEFKNISWQAIAKPKPDEYPQRPLELEDFINNALFDKQIDKLTIKNINKIFNLRLKTPSQGLYKLPEHTHLMEELPAEIEECDRSNVINFLAYLERIKTCWSQETQVAVGQNKKRPVILEETVQVAMDSLCLISLRTRESLNKAFGLELERRILCNLPEHLELLRVLPRIFDNGDTNYNRQYILMFFAHLEGRRTQWSTVRTPAPGDNPLCPTLLEAAVTEAIATGAHASTRAALNQEFGLQLRGPVDEVKASKKRDCHGFIN
jgi:hypothetical protein